MDEPPRAVTAAAARAARESPIESPEAAGAGGAMREEEERAARPAPSGLSGGLSGAARAAAAVTARGPWSIDFSQESSSAMRGPIKSVAPRRFGRLGASACAPLLVNLEGKIVRGFH